MEMEKTEAQMPTQEHFATDEVECAAAEMLDEFREAFLELAK